MDELQKTVGRQVAFHRRRTGLTQAALAENVGLSVDMIAKLEIGAAAPSLRTVAALATAFGIDAAQLLTTKVVGDAAGRPELSSLISRLNGLGDDQLGWVAAVIDAALKRQP